MSDIATIEEEVEVTPEVSLRETLEAEFDKAEIADDQNVKEPAAPSPKPASEPAAEPAALATPEAKPAAKDSEAPAPAVPAVPGELKAPAQWKPAVREKWNALPREVQEEVLRREGDSMRLIGSVGPKIRLADEVSGYMQPFTEALNANGVHPSAFLSDVFTSVKSLASGNPQEKAEIVANIVQSYGVDLKTLDAILTQRLQAPPEVWEARRATARANDTITQHKQSLEHQSSLEAEKALASFGADPKHEFLADVKDLMADLIEAGRVETLDDAYSAAVWAHPDTRKILLQREATSRAEVKGQRAAAARRASSAVHGSPAAYTTAAPKANASLRETLEAAFDEHTQP